MKYYHKILFAKRHKAVKTALCLLVVLLGFGMQAQKSAKVGYKNPQKPVAALEGSKAKHVKRITPQIPQANRNQRNKVFLENADVLSANEAVSTDYQVLKGNVKFRRGNMYMYCDSAYFYSKTSSLDAFGNVKLIQGDSLKVFADVLHYYGDDEIAQLRYNVKMQNRSMTLYTDSLDYETRTNVGYYFNGGRLIDGSHNTLTSEFGRYELDTKKAEFSTNVHLVNKKYDMRTDMLDYNTATHVADIVAETVIRSDSSTIRTNKGWYNTAADNSTLYNRSTLYAKDGKTLVGDTLYYSRRRGYGEAKGNVILTDDKHKVILDGNYGYHNENTHYSYATRHARAREFSQKDTLYLHGDTLRTFLDSCQRRVLTASPKVRFFRNDVQGLCDSMAFSQADTIVRLYKHAVVWNENKQISGEEINVHMNDSTVDWALMPNSGIVAEHLGETYYNQLSGRVLKAYFLEKELRKVDVNGNVLTIFYPMEKDSTYNKLVSAESSYLTINLKPKQEIDKVKMWPEVNGKLIPLFLAKRSDLYLPGFEWYESLRPKKPDDIYDVSDEMKQLLSKPSTGGRHKRSSSNI